jgi:hypothetical protein
MSRIIFCTSLRWRGEFHEGFNHDLTEEIVSREVEYVDNEGLITEEVRVLWSVGGWSAPNWSQAN